MGSEWKLVKLADCAAFQEGYVNPSQKNSQYFDGPVKWLRAVDLNDGFVYDTSRTLSDEGFNSAGRSALLFKPGTLAISKSGTIGRVGILQDYMCGNRAVINITVDESKCDNRFIFYVLKKNREFFEMMATGSVQKNLYTSVLGSLEFLLPAKEVQEKIGSLLGSVDEKIELNRQINATLESMAQALFKSWFVDFDPVIDNALAAGNPIPEPLQARADKRATLLAAASAADTRSASVTDNAHPTQTAPHTRPDITAPATPLQPLPTDLRALFPDSFVFNEEMGWVPEGWAIGSVGDEFDVTMGQSPPGDTYNESGEGTPFFQGRADFGFRFPANRVFCIAPKRMANKGDTLVSVRAPVGDVNMAAENCCIGRGVAAVRHKSGSISYTYYAMRQLRERFAVFEGEGTVFGSINQRDFKALPQVSATADVIFSFNELVSSFDSKVESQSLQISCLTGIRDSLLPKLLSGQIKLPETRKLVTEAV